MKYSIICLTVALIGSQAFNTFGGNGNLRTQPFDGNNQIHILPFPSDGVTPGEAQILPYFPVNKNNNAEGVQSLPYPTGNDEMRIMPVSSGQRTARQTGDVRSLPYFPGNNGNVDGFKTVSSGSGTNGQVRMLPKSTESHNDSDEMRIMPVSSGQRVKKSTGEVQILPYFSANKDTTSGFNTMPFPTGSNGNDQVRILPIDNGNSHSLRAMETSTSSLSFLANK
ncbi:hypothetical protein PRIPAC_78807 [Pristionchus pacificus]|uniref:Uncharacterized protein n=1 Tax=Pristionchus pacificus TaxID=54126 RepID=A0A2A6CLL4_PRIPA|nr:hypothetical protein PRIPAC_78807 [Pristionchus pacificus]|eukprot:PDM78967.1 hypothetical protein PRIPAC_31546 [Pristionchus pacificus]